jgi:hypothetical protein
MNKPSYFPVAVRATPAPIAGPQVLYHSTPHHVVFKKDGKHFISFSAGGRLKVPQPFVVTGDIVKLHMMTNSILFICTTLNTYFLQYSDNLNAIALGFICIEADISRNKIVMKTSDGKIRRYTSNGAMIDDTVAIVCDHQVLQDGEYCQYVDCHGAMYKVYQSMVPTEIFLTCDEMSVLRIDDTFFLNTNNHDALEFMSQDFAMRHIFVDNSACSTNTTRNAFILDTQGNMWTILKVESIYTFVRLCNICTPEQINAMIPRIKKVVMTMTYLWVFGDTFTNMYFYDAHSPVEPPPIVFPMGFDNECEYITNIYNKEVVMKYGPNYVLVTSLSLADMGITSKELNYTRFVGTDLSAYGLNAYLISAVNPVTQVLFCNGTFYACRDGVIRGKTDADPFAVSQSQAQAQSQSEQVLKYVAHKLPLMDITVDSSFGAFEQIYNTLISFNYRHALMPSIMTQSRIECSGPGVVRDIYSRVVQYIETDLLSVGTQGESTLNLSNAFWDLIHNSYYFGKMLGYMATSEWKFQRHFSISQLLIIHNKLKLMKASNETGKATNVLTVNQLDLLAPYHNEFDPEGFRAIMIMDSKYKLIATEFKNLGLPYDSFLHMICEKFNIKEVTDREHQCLTQIAIGMYHFNKTFSELDLFDLSRAISGDFKYDRFAIITNISISATIESHKMLFIDFLTSLSDDELKVLMINITGYTKSSVKVNVAISVVSSTARDFSISTCSNSMIINQDVFKHDDWPKILRGYLCHHDKRMSED